jgi:ABC-type proline/glycine betaine transport system ATPase subunit
MKTIKRNGRETIIVNPCNMKEQRIMGKRIIRFRKGRISVINSHRRSVYDDMPDFIEGMDIPKEISFSKMFKEMRNDFLIGRIKKGEISKDDPEVKRLLEE